MNTRITDDHQAVRLTLLPAEARTGLGGKIIGVTNAGQRLHVGISLADCRHHLHVLGPTGTGKTSLLLRMILDDAEAGRGVAAFDPAKGDLIRDLLGVLPADCGNRLVIIDPDETSAPPAINLLDPTVCGGSPHDVAAGVTSVMSKVWSRWWGHRSADICYHGLLTLASVPGSTLAQLPRLLSDSRWRAGKVQSVIDRLDVWEGVTLAEFWEGFDALPPGQRSALVAPLLSRLRLVLAHPLAQGLFGVAATTFSFADILDGGILLVRLPKGVVGEDGTRLIGSLLLAGLWQATAARARVDESERLDATVVLDECHNFLHLPIGIDDALAESRGLHTSFVLAHQYLGQLSGEMAEAIDANARNKVYFALAPKDAVDQVHHVHPYLDHGDLIRLGGFEVVFRPVASGRVVPPVTVDTLAPPCVVPGRAEDLRRAAREHTGLACQVRRRLRSQALVASVDPQTVDPQVVELQRQGEDEETGKSEEIGSEGIGKSEGVRPEWIGESDDDNTPNAFVGANTFMCGVGRWLEVSNEDSHGGEHPGEHAGVFTDDQHVTG